MHVGSGIHFESSSAEGAVLVLPDGGLRKDLSSVTKALVKRYAEQHALSWRDLANGGPDSQGGCTSLYLLTGVDKTTSWGIASYSNISRAGGISLKFKADPVMSGNVCYAHRWEVNSGANVRVGPKYTDPAQLRQQRNLVTNLGQSGEGQQRNRDGLHSILNQAQGGSGAGNRQPGSTQIGGRRRGRGHALSPEPLQQPPPSDAVAEPNNQSTPQPPNQCIFVRGYMLSFRDDLIPLRNPIKVSNIGSNSKDAGSSTAGSWMTNIRRSLNPRSTNGSNISAGQSVSTSNRDCEMPAEDELVIEDITSTFEVSLFWRSC